MGLIEWRDEFSVGVPGVDHEHREMIDLINTLYDSFEEPDSELSVLDLLGEIHAKISAHFAFEEKEMRDRNYDQFQDHKEDHERLLDEIRDIMDEAEIEGRFDRDTLAARLNAWFVEHFKTKDARLHKYLG